MFAVLLKKIWWLFPFDSTDIQINLITETVINVALFRGAWSYDSEAAHNSVRELNDCNP